MSRFIVCVREVHVQRLAIEADNEGEAIFMVANGEGDPVGGLLPEFSDRLDPETWTVERG